MDSWQKFMDDDDEEKKIITTVVPRDWNAKDFTGKYHYSRFDNKETPLPGTQVNEEVGYLRDKAKNSQLFDNEMEKTHAKMKEKLRIKGESAAMKTRVYFDTLLGESIRQSEKVLSDRDHILNNNSPYKDSQKEIDKYMKNISLGRHHYVGFAASTGFESINYQEAEWGNSALHLAVKKGHLLAAEELCRYHADPNLKNRLGYRPIHLAWSFWNTDFNRTREEREAQEKLTCDILVALLSYDAHVDAIDLDGHTALHIAARLGPVTAVKTLLSFKADSFLQTNDGRIALDIALQFGQEEIYKLLEAWEHIKPHLLKLDFHAVWHKFLRDHEAVINDHKSAQVVLSEIAMSSNIRTIDRGIMDGVRIDDPLLRSTCVAARGESLPLKPWDGLEWSEFVKRQEDAGKVDLRTEMENLNKDLRGEKVAAKTVGYRKIRLLGSDKVIEDKPIPPPKPRLLGSLKRSDKSFSLERELVDDVDYAKVSGESEEYHHVEGLNSATAATAAAVSASASISTSCSSLAQRRLRLAEQVAVDGKFLQFSKRLALSSAMMMPLRTPQAPLAGTEEEGDPLRKIASQGPDFDKFEKYKRLDKMASYRKVVPSTNTIGMYDAKVISVVYGERDALFDHLVFEKKAYKEDSSSGAVESATSSSPSSHAHAKAGRALLDISKKDKIDLVGNSRRRYVVKDLLPSTRILSAVELLSKEDKERNGSRHSSNSKSGLVARSAVEQSIAEGAAAAQSGSEDVSDSFDTLQHRRKALTLKRLFLQKEEVHYGEGRITSTHNTAGKLEEPWTTVKGRYATLPGDRTA